MSKISDTRTTLQRTVATLEIVEKLLADMLKNQERSIKVETDRASYKEGLVDGLCMMSWEKKVEVEGEDGLVVMETKDYVGGGEGNLLSDVLEEIGSVYGFDGKAELLRVKCTDEDGIVKGNLTEVIDEDEESGKGGDNNG